MPRIEVETRGKRFVVKNDGPGWMVAEPATDRAGRVRDESPSYHPTLSSALGSLMERGLRASDATTLAELLAEAKEFREMVERLIGEEVGSR